MSGKTKTTAGAAIFQRLKALGVEYVFANSGTDFPPIIEGLVRAQRDGIALPEAVTIPHEHVAMGMAHGHWLISGKPQAVMLHTNVGLANGAIGAINAACEHVPMLLMSGRTPVTEHTRFGARTVPIGWGQEMRDQTALVREASKWDYELRFPEQIGEVLDRGWAIAESTPKGPIYLSLPREVLCETIKADLDQPPAMTPVNGSPTDDAIATAAKWLAEARHPLVIAQRGAGDEEIFAQFADWADKWAIPVCSWWATRLAISTEHPMHVGPDPKSWLAEADCVLVLDCLAPWWPDKHPVNPDAKIIHAGPDPLFSRFPIRNFRSDLSLAGESNLLLPRLFSAMEALPHDAEALSDRRQNIIAKSQENRSKARQSAQDSAVGGITKAYLSLKLGEMLQGLRSSVFSELGAQLGVLKCTDYQSWFQEPHSGGLGWSVPAAMGARLADPERLCVAVCGDGSYMFANPTACHLVAEAIGIPFLTVIANNAEWGAVRASVEGLYPEGSAAKANRMPLTALSPSPDFTLTAQASRAYAKQVTDPATLEAELAEAIRVVTEERRQALLDVRVLPD
ncbi:thiamine pyrophosphate-requiring protein [Notoacmeibacter sp. MSK16QG-6]|uniref:thiamine pyrophosphate-requiring protein n=1 Tax=Notoacmeibacter sp. MSK16QG-6 TaxID=2957982 RepID=UPI0020A19CFA|nr:thiamine pyrophosphate-requiring protein [Notoacmeibacter sp. MSK16QG-6]MCP1199518.1 thiamine pyrophosphate-requiring protein [Notoacmeibacter sp. MSK16QG-6]